MNIQKMILIDRWVGVPICAVVSGVQRVLSLFRGPASESSPVRSIVFIKLAEQGSTVLAQTALQEAVRRVERENVYMVVFQENRFIVDVLDLLPAANIVTVRSTTLPSLIGTALVALGRLRRLRPGAVIDLEFFARSSALLAWLIGAPVRVGFHSFFGEGPYRGNLMTHRVRYNPHLHTVQSFASLVEALDVPPETLPRFDMLPAPPSGINARFAPAADEIEGVERILRELSGSETVPPLILLNANASDMLPLRRWDPARYVELARLLLARFPEIRVGFTGAGEEAAAVDRLVAKVGDRRCFSLAGKTTLRQLLVLYGLAEVLVTNDSGPAHFASLTPIQSVTLFGPETPLLFGAPTPRNTSLWAGIACSPCVSALNNRQSACTNNACMQRISIDQVFEAVVASYRARQEGRRPDLTSTPRTGRTGEEMKTGSTSGQVETAAAC